MKLIKASIRHRKLEEVYNALNSADFCRMTFAECEGTGQYSDLEKEHISDKYSFAETYRVIKLEILVAKEDMEPVVELIRKNGRTGYPGGLTDDLLPNGFRRKKGPIGLPKAQ